MRERPNKSMKLTRPVLVAALAAIPAVRRQDPGASDELRNDRWNN